MKDKIVRFKVQMWGENASQQETEGLQEEQDVM